jgi:hypothetical protein
VLRIVPQRRYAIVLLTNSGTGRALYRAIFPELMRTCFGIEIPALKLDPSPGVAGDLSRFAGVYPWPDRRWEVTATDVTLVIKNHATFNALPIDEQTFLIDPDDPDTPTMTFGDFDDDRRPLRCSRCCGHTPASIASPTRREFISADGRPRCGGTERRSPVLLTTPRRYPIRAYSLVGRRWS